MNKDYELSLIQLNTELENAIGFRNHYYEVGDYNLYNMWDQTIEEILDQVREIASKVK